MTTNQKNLGGIKVNGRTRYYDHLSNFRRISPSTWMVERGMRQYRIEGGRAAGGRANEWFLDGGDLNGTINCKSLVDALHLLETM